MDDSGGDVVLGELDGKNLALVVEKPGTQTVYFDWSARGTIGPGGLPLRRADRVNMFSMGEPFVSKRLQRFERGVALRRHP